MTHSLTNEMCHELSCWPLEELDELYVDGVMTDMRAAYDLAIEHMSQWIKENGHEYVVYDPKYGRKTFFIQMIADFKQGFQPSN